MKRTSKLYYFVTRINDYNIFESGIVLSFYMYVLYKQNHKIFLKNLYVKAQTSVWEDVDVDFEEPFLDYFYNCWSKSFCEMMEKHCGTVGDFLDKVKDNKIQLNGATIELPVDRIIAIMKEVD